MKIAIIVGIVVVLIAILVLVLAIKSAKPHEGSLWCDRKRTIFGLPWSFTVYEITDDRLFVQSGFLSITDEEIRLYRIMDITYRAGVLQRLFGVGSIEVVTSDRTASRLVIQSVKNPRDVKELLTKKVEEQRDKKRVVSREMVVNDDLDADTDTEF